MTAHLLLEHFDYLLATPDDVDALNRAILKLAVQGGLVPQEPSDEPAEVLLQSIRAIKVTNGKSESMPQVGDNEKLHELPNGWAWTRLGEIGQIVGGGTPSTSRDDYYSGDGIPWLTPADLYKHESKTISRGRRFISQLGIENSSARLLPVGTVLFSSRAPIGYVAIAANSLATNQGFKSWVPYFDGMSDFLFYFLKAEAKNIDDRASGTTFKEVSGRDMQQVVVALPPLAEQHRIVARVEELFALTRALAERLAHAETELANLNQAALHHLLAAETPEDFDRQWAFILQHFDALISQPEHVAPLRQTILELAVRGKLTRRESGDEPASELLKRIRAQKAKNNGKGEALPLIGESERPFELPEGWEWTTIDAIAETGTGSTPSRGNPEYFEQGSIPWVTSSATGQPFISQTEEFVTELAAQNARLRLYPTHTLIVALYGQGKTRGQVSELLIPATINQACASVLFEGESSGLRPYAKLFLVRNYHEFRSQSEGGAQPNLNVGKLKKVAVPLPPLAEQRRIVARVEALLKQCNGLEAALREAQEERVRLRTTVLVAVGKA